MPSYLSWSNAEVNAILEALEIAKTALKEIASRDALTSTIGVAVIIAQVALKEIDARS